MDLLDNPRVALVREAPSYPAGPPFHPSEEFPEWAGAPTAAEDNAAYRAVRDVLHHLALDAERYGQPDWNPLGSLIQPGHRVVLKPNLVSHRNPRRRPLADACLVTHGSVIRAVLDYVAKALQGRGAILIADCPIQGAQWDTLVEMVGLPEILQYAVDRFPGIHFAVADHRLGRAVVRHGMVAERVVEESSLDRYREVDLGQRSELIGLMTGKWAFGCAQYSKRRMRAAHTPQSNTYLMHEDFLEADVLINLPKMKSHMKAGITGAMKNLVGLIGHKDYLPHFRFGSPQQGGDEYPDGNYLWDFMWLLYHLDWERDRGLVKRFLNYGIWVCHAALRLAGYGRGAGTALGGGSWYGNDTVWRTILDINRAFFYYDRPSQTVGDVPYPGVRYLAIMDGLIGGAKESPLSPTPVASGTMLGSFNPVAMDAVAAAVMGLDVRKIPQVAHALATPAHKDWDLPLARFDLHDVRIAGNTSATSIADVYRHHEFLPFEPSRGFKGFIEYTGSHQPGSSGEPSAPDVRRFLGKGNAGLQGREAGWSGGE